ncbi:MAG TPA: GMC family oxidoreductase [Terriglobales bacterium]|nr:GMC family oxidoreductase [Terriglobales bacterium]
MDAILANSWGDRRPDGYDAVVVGSGYGGAITAARLANAAVNPKLSVCILERGQEWPVGEFPDNFGDVLGNSYNPVLNPLGLYEFDAFPDIAVIKGSGLGGTSLVNANVAIRPEPDVFATWPSALKQAAQIGETTPGSLWNYYKRAEETLEVSSHPTGSTLKKFQALKKRASELGQFVETLPLAVNFQKEGVEVYKRNGGSIVKHRCIDCGDCVTGCNVGAKNTLYMNYLPLAKTGGAHMFTQAEVDYVERKDSQWVVHVTHRDDAISSEDVTITARMVVLAAGALGSPRILLRSRDEGLATSAVLGSRFSGNGDFFGLAYNSSQFTDILGWGNHRKDPIAQVVRAGPSIVGLVRYNEKAPPGQRFVIEDLSIPRAYRDAAAAAFRILPGTVVGGQDSAQAQERLDKDILGADPQGALNSSMLYLCMTQDDSGGTLSLDESGNVQVDWPGAGAEAIFKQVNQECLAHATALGSYFIENPLWKASPWQTLITAHPLGGCPMGEDGSDGAVDHLGRVFQGARDEVHPSLYVADGSIVRTALGVNPFLTISALSERIVDYIISGL